MMETILVVTNREDYTADYLILELRDRGINFTRFNTEEFPRHVRVVWKMNKDGGLGHFEFQDNRVIQFSDVKSVWYRRPVAPTQQEKTPAAAYAFISTESRETLAGVWRTLDCFWVSHPDSLYRAEFKLHQLAVARRAGFDTPATIVTNDPRQARRFYKTHEGRVVYKPLKHSRIIRGEDVSLIYTNPILSDAAEKLDNVQYAPTLLQRYVPKQFELRVTVIGSKAFAVALHSQDSDETRHDWRRGDVRDLRHEPYELPPKVKTQCTELVRSLGLAFGAIDLILTPSGDYMFLEINPNGQWAWIQQMLPEVPLRETLADLLSRGKA